MGGGFEIALACDIIVAAENAVFALPEVRVGLAALAGGVHRLPRTIGTKQALGMILTGRRVERGRGSAARLRQRGRAGGSGARRCPALGRADPGGLADVGAGLQAGRATRASSTPVWRRPAPASTAPSPTWWGRPTSSRGRRRSPRSARRTGAVRLVGSLAASPRSRVTSGRSAAVAQPGGDGVDRQLQRPWPRARRCRRPGTAAASRSAARGAGRGRGSGWPRCAPAWGCRRADRRSR